MDANIKAAAANLRRASYNLRDRIHQLQLDESNARRHENQEENSLKRDLSQTRYDLSKDQTDRGALQGLVKHGYELHKRLGRIKTKTTQQISTDENEIKVLQSQIAQLDTMAQKLETWK